MSHWHFAVRFASECRISLPNGWQLTMAAGYSRRSPVEKLGIKLDRDQKPVGVSILTPDS
jgi:hypothetical protein